MILIICIQLLQERLPYNSVRMYVTTSKSIMGIGVLVVQTCLAEVQSVSAWMKEIAQRKRVFTNTSIHAFFFLLVETPWTSSLPQPSNTKQSLPIIPIGTIQTLLRFENLCQNSWCMLGQMTMTTMIWWWWWYCKWQSRSKKNQLHEHCLSLKEIPHNSVTKLKFNLIGT